MLSLFNGLWVSCIAASVLSRWVCIWLPLKVIIGIRLKRLFKIRLRFFNRRIPISAQMASCSAEHASCLCNNFILFSAASVVFIPPRFEYLSGFWFSITAGFCLLRNSTGSCSAVCRACSLASRAARRRWFSWFSSLIFHPELRFLAVQLPDRYV